MKRFLILSIALVMLFCSCQKKRDDGFDLLSIPEDAKLSVLDPSSYDVISYSRDNEDIESLIDAVNAVGALEVTAQDYIDYKDDTPSVTIFIEDGEIIYIFKVWSMGDGECGVTEQVVGSNQVIYTLTFKSETVAELTEKIYAELRG